MYGGLVITALTLYLVIWYIDVERLGTELLCKSFDLLTGSTPPLIPRRALHIA